jgi:hypothetical protein
MKIYYEDFTSLENVCDSFGIDQSELNGAEIIYAVYDRPDYEGWAQVIFVRDGKLYEAHGSHCSCYGLEDQWAPEETLPIALLSRPNVSVEAKNNIKEFYKNLLVFA